jgi:hypothetical protein
MLETDDTAIIVPKADGVGTIRIDLGEIAQAEARLMEVATVNQTTAPELLATYNRVWLKLDRTVGNLTWQRDQATNKYKRARADAKLACTDDVLKAKGHSKASADLREAIVETDETVIKTKECLDTIEVVLSVIKGKREAFLNAYNSVKKLTGGGTLPTASYGDGNRPTAFAPPELQLPKDY